MTETARVQRAWPRRKLLCTGSLSVTVTCWALRFVSSQSHLDIGHSLHVPGPAGADPSTYGVDPTTGPFTFTTHIDTAYPTWHTPIGAIIHYFVDVRDKGAHSGPC